MRPLHRRLLPAALALLGACASVSSPRAPREALLAAPAVQELRLAPFDVEHYALDLRLDPQARSFQGTCRLRLWPTVAPLEAVQLDLCGLEVEAVRDAAGRDLGFAHFMEGFGDLDGSLRITLAAPASPGQPVELDIRYGGAPRKGLWFAAEVDGAPTQAFTQGECADARWWFPCFDEPHDRATSELRVELPPGWRSVAAGELIERELLADGWTAERWRMSVPHPTYLLTLVAGELVELQASWEGVPLHYLAAPRYADVLERSFAETPRVLAVLSELTGVRYPYPKYSQACVDNFPFGGMENVSATTMTDGMLRDERGAPDYDPAGLIAHEAAHQWFGDLLTCADWSHIWLNEGFATYFTQLYFERTRGRDEFLIGVRDMQDAYVAGDVGAGRRAIVWDVYKDPMDLFFGGQTYPGGGSRLHLLRFVLGDEAFFEGIRTYVTTNAGRAVTTSDLQRAMESVSARDLETFFQQWLRSPGYPELDVRWDWDEASGEVVVAIEQTQAYADGTPVVFRVPAEIGVRTRGGLELHRVELDRRRQRLRLPAPERPQWVRFDPRSWIPKRLNEVRPLSEWLRLAEAQEDPNARRDALAVLGRTIAEEGTDAAEREAAAAAVAARLGSDPAPAVRVAAARAAGAGGPRGGAGLQAALMAAGGGDAEAAVRVAALGALRGWGADDELARYARAQFDAGFSWATMGAAADLVRASEPDRDASYAWLAERLDLASPHDELRAALLGSLGATGLPRAVEILQAFALDDAAGQAARVAAVRELGRLARHDPRVRQDLVGLLDTPLYRLRAAAVEALGELAAADNAAALSALEQAYARETDARIRRSIEAIVRRERARP